MNFKKMILSLVVFTLLPSLHGCSSDAAADAGTEIPVEYQIDAGVQQNIFYQQITVIDDDETYNNFLLSIPSMSSSAPNYDFNVTTVVGVITDIQGCSFFPQVESVIETDRTVKVSILNVKDIHPETCNPMPVISYGYFLVSVLKTDKPISVIIENE